MTNLHVPPAIRLALTGTKGGEEMTGDGGVLEHVIDGVEDPVHIAQGSGDP